MPYITVRQPPPHQQITFDDLFLSPTMQDQAQPVRRDMSGTITRFVKEPRKELLQRTDVDSLISCLEIFNQRHEDLSAAERRSLYHTFFIPKHSGGLRKIDEPNENLMNALRELKSIFENKMGVLYHTSAFAYVPGRSTIDAIKRHQANESRWFLKTDFSNFFGSTTEDFLYRAFSVMFPFSEIVKTKRGSEALKKALSLCFLDGGLQQGTPISPMLTNAMMIPIDHRLFNGLTKQGFVYTRYADDIQISSKYSFDYKEMVAHINGVVKDFGAPFVIKDQKTRYGSSSGRNWNLGLMLNKDNNITVGYQRKKQVKAMTNNFIVDHLNHIPWPKEDVRHFDGILSYCKMVEKEYFEHMIKAFEEKYKVNFKIMMKAALEQP